MGEKEIKVKLGLTLLKLRTEKNLSQERLAQMVDSHRNYIGRVERGEQSPTLTFWFRIAKALNLKLSDIILMVEN
jgi:transcriptional regulator with XRE-family HTH domain